MAAYNDFAYIYDRLMKADIDYCAWCDYIENLFSRHDAEPDTICELACGTGNMTEQIKARGYDVTGVDISRDMLTAASGKLKGTRLVCSDMSKYNENVKYDAFLCMIDGVNYVIEPKRLERTFKNVRSMLNDGGVFIFDVSTRYKLKHVIGSETFIHSDYDVFYSWQNNYIEKYSLSDMLLNFFVREGSRYRRFEERHLQRGYSEQQLKILLQRAGFSDIAVYDEMSFDAPRSNSERIVFVCKMKKI